MAFTSETARVAGAKGGQATLARYGVPHLRTIGRRGWTAMVARHGHAALRANGKKGFQATADRYFGGDRQALTRWLTNAGLAAQDTCPANGAWQRRQPWPTPHTDDEHLQEETQ